LEFHEKFLVLLSEKAHENSLMSNHESNDRGEMPARHNMGVGNDQVSCSIDYLSITWPDLPGMYDHILNLLGGKGKWIRIGGHQGYGKGVERGEIRVYSEGNGTILAVLKGEGCRQLASERAITTEADWQNLVREISESGGRATRIDVAFDDFRGIVKFSTIYRKACEHHFTTEFRKYWTSTDRATGADRQISACVKFGGKQSDRQVVIYDKALESGSEGPWIRIETQARRAVARALMLRFLEDGFAAITADIRARITFRVPPRGDRSLEKELWKVCRWWDQMVGSRSTKFSPIESQVARQGTDHRLIQFRALLVKEYEEAGEAGLKSLWLRCAMLADDALRKAIQGYEPKSRGGKWNRIIRLNLARREAERGDQALEDIQ